MRDVKNYTARKRTSVSVARRGREGRALNEAIKFYVCSFFPFLPFGRAACPLSFCCPIADKSTLELRWSWLEKVEKPVHFT